MQPTRWLGTQQCCAVPQHPPSRSHNPQHSYARTDEIGVPFAITVDFQALEQASVTVRERDSTSQVCACFVCIVVGVCVCAE